MKLINIVLLSWLLLAAQSLSSQAANLPTSMVRELRALLNRYRDSGHSR